MKPYVGLALILVASAPLAASAGQRSRGDDVPLATPIGVTLQRAGEKAINQGGGGFVAASARRMVFGTADGRTLYTYDKDTAGVSACVQECAQTWKPFTAPAKAKGVGAWSVIKRADGSAQWAYHTKPLYSYSKDAKPGDLTGENAENGLWHKATYDLTIGRDLPYGMITVAEIAEANGQGLIDARGLTIYALEGKDDSQPACSGLCAKTFTPLVAPLAVKPIGDFTIVERADGTRQWAYQGKPLYTFEGDQVRGDVSGKDVDKRWRIALVERYYMPAEVTITPTMRGGNLFADAKGMLLYRQEGYTLLTAGGTNLRRNVSPRPDIGREIGWQSCVGACLEEWQPLTASKDAQPSGYWEIATRDDGTRQWVYQGYALYTYKKETRPGAVTGAEKHIYFISDDPSKEAKPPTRMQGAGALYWIYNAP